MMKQEIATILRRAAAVVQAKGLARGIRQGPGGSVCALGALDEVYREMFLAMRGGTWGRPAWCRADVVVCAVVEKLDLTRGDHRDPYNLPVHRNRPDGYLARWSNLSAGAEEVAGGFLKVAEELEREERERERDEVPVPVPVQYVQYSTVPPVVPIQEVEVEERELVEV